MPNLDYNKPVETKPLRPKPLASRKFWFTALAFSGAAWLFVQAMMTADTVAAEKAMEQIQWILGFYFAAEGAADVAGRWQSGKAQVKKTEIETREILDELDDNRPIVAG